MPLNESPHKPSGLTREQRAQAQRAIYGLPAQSSNPPNVFTPEQIEFMRSQVAQHDREHNRISEFDLNKPPQQPYRYQEFPRMLYHHGRFQMRIVRDQIEMDALVEAGWSAAAFTPEVNEPELDTESAQEAAELDAALARKRTK